MKKKGVTIAILIATVILAVIAIVTATRLYQIGKEPVAPTVPKPAPAFDTDEELPAVQALPEEDPCYLTFNISTTLLECWDECVVDSDCPGSLVCQEVGSVDLCVNPDCPEEEDCTCPGETPTPTETSTPTPTSPPGETPTPTPTTAELPEAGFSLPTLGAVMGGLLLVVVSLLFAL